ncbi:MAG: response regulator [bacterium]|nr:response regulator [bacterium]
MSSDPVGPDPAVRMGIGAMPHRILIVDHDPSARCALESYLGKSLGYEVVAVHGRQEALAAAMQSPFDLCILDVSLPGAASSETYTRLKNIHPSIEAIFFTPSEGCDTEKDFLHFALPPERAMAKSPCDLTQLTRLIISILGPPVG